MHALARIWLVCADDLPLSVDTVGLLRRLAPRFWLREQSVADEVALALGTSLGTPAPEWGACALDDASLRALADRHPAESVAVLLPRSLALELLTGALDLQASAQLESVRFELCALDWPQSADLEGRPALIGIDLDWLPPPPPKARAKFPGGPGSAPANR